jgi:hypothetical protein
VDPRLCGLLILQWPSLGQAYQVSIVQLPGRMAGLAAVTIDIASIWVLSLVLAAKVPLDVTTDELRET